MSPVAAPADKRFRRALVKPARRRHNWRRAAILATRSLVVAMLAASVAYGGWRVAARGHVLRVERIVVQGNERLSNGEVLAILNGLAGESLLWTDLAAWRRRLLSSPWVSEAALRRSIPSTIEVVVSERTPIGIGRINSDLYLIDDRGTVIDQYGPQYADLDLPIIDGLAAAPSDGAGEMADLPRARLAARVIAAVKAKPAIARRLSQVDVADVHNASVILSGDPAVLALGDDQFLQRLQAYLDVSPALHDRVADIDYVDLRFDERIYVRPAGRAANAAAAAGKRH